MHPSRYSDRRSPQWQSRSFRSVFAPLSPLQAILATKLLISLLLLSTSPRKIASFVIPDTFRRPISQQHGTSAALRLGMTTLSSTGSLERHWNDTVFDHPDVDIPPVMIPPGKSNHWNVPDTETESSSSSSSSDDDPTSSRSTLGDIMGLVTESEGLAAHYGIDHPLDRMALTANGNLQRLISSYYDAPVSVVVDHCRERPTTTTTTTTSSPSSTQRDDPRPVSATWDRRVSLRIFGRTFCVATSVIRVHEARCVTWVESGRVGLGQLFRALNVLPTFTLRKAGRTGTVDDDAKNDNTTSALRSARDGGGGGFWREYSLTCAELSCEIREEFVAGLWTLKPPSSR